MKKTLHFIALGSIILSLFSISCVSSKKFKRSESKVDNLQKDSISTHNRLSECYAVADMLQKDSVETHAKLNEHTKLVSNLEKEKALLENKNTLVNDDLQTLSKKSKTTIAEQESRLKKLQDLIQGQRNIMAKLKNSITDALMNYKTDELSVYTKNGNVYVSLEEKLLFKSGSDVVDPKGKEALKSLAKIINNTSDITVMIEGHTDNVPIKTAQFKDNWDLSTARATSILRILTKDYGFDPIRITASGKGEFHPIKGNDTENGRASNRRTEIILSPNLNELFNLLNQ